MRHLSAKIKINRDTLLYLTLLYIYLPIIIFLLTWVKLMIAVPVLVFSFAALYRLTMDQYCKNEREKREDISIHILLMLFFIVIVFVFGYYMGWSGGAPQSGDWSKHNAILRDLIEYEWPVYYRKGEETMLSYYIAQYLIPAFVAKLGGKSFEVGQLIMYSWNCLGILLAVLWICTVVKAGSIRKQIAAVTIFLFFGGMLPIAQIILTGWNRNLMGGQLDMLHFVNAEDIFLQYRSNLVSMRWVFPQCIVPWLTVLLFYHDTENRKHYVTILLPGLIYGTLSFLGMAILVLLHTAISFLIGKKSQKFLREIFSIWNIGMLLTLGVVLAAYLWGNVFSKKPEEISTDLIIYGGRKIVIYLVFCFCMFGAHAILIARRNAKNILFYVTVAVLLVIPFIRMGIYNDFCMCVSIAPLFLLMLLIMQYLFEHASESAEQMKKGMLIVCLCIGMLYPAVELYGCVKDDDRSRKQTEDYYQSLAAFSDRSRRDITQDLRYNYYAYDLDENFFVNYMARIKN